MEEAQRAADDEQRLACAMVVTHLYQEQISTMNDEILGELQELHAAGDPGFGRARDWTQHGLTRPAPACSNGLISRTSWSKEWAGSERRRWPMDRPPSEYKGYWTPLRRAYSNAPSRWDRSD